LNRKVILLLVIFLSFLSKQLLAWDRIGDNVDLTCNQSINTLDCKYRTLNSEKISSISANSNNIDLQINESAEYPADNDVTAVLFLIDTSDPARQNVIEKNKVHVKKLLSTLKSHHKAGLATFDKSLQIKSTLGSSSFLISKELEPIEASGKTTELYRSLLTAIQHLKSFNAQRKVIVLLSDGQAEDKAYFHSDVIKKARETGVIINSIGYPRSVALSVALQTLRRLSEETGGSYIETDISYNLSNNYLNNPFSNIDNGKSFTIDLSELQKDTPSSSIKISFTTETGIKNIIVPISIKAVKKPDIQKSPVTFTETESSIQAKSNINNPPVQIITKQTEIQPVNLWLWYGLPAAFIIIIIFILITLFLLWNVKADAKDKGTQNDYRPYAYLTTDDGTQTRYPITRTIWRIGRSKDNELHLDDTSISRRHAEIHRNNNGTFEIVDMNSMNGVYINNEKIGKAELHEGDIVEIGDIVLHFTQLASDYSLEESTVMQKTRTPSIN
jgi:uncharacterized protein YegL